MRYAIGSKVPLPSPNLLRFLRTQSDEVCFFTINSIASRSSFPRTRSLFARCLPASRRRLCTSPRPLATVQASILNLDFLRPTSRNVTANNAPTLQHGSQSGLPTLNDLKEKLSSSCSPSSSRYVSTNSRPLLDKIFGLRRTDFAPRPNGPAPLPSFLDDVNGASLGRSKASRANELKIRCTEFNEEGKATLMDGEFKKTELIAKVCSVVACSFTRITLTSSVWAAPSRSSKNRFFTSPAYSRPTNCNSNQPSPSPCSY